MRNAVINELTRIAENDSRLVVLTADLGFSVFEEFQQKYPKRFYNVGICESFMSSAASGLALTGLVPITYSIGNFNTLRCIEQIRNDICYHNAHVIVISVGTGFAYGQLGMSHHATEDIAMMRSLPNIRIYSPADPEEAVEALRKSIEYNGPSYIRLARRGEPILYEKPVNFDVSFIQSVIDEPDLDVALLGTGPILGNLINAASELKKNGIKVGVFSCPSVKPFDYERLDVILNKSKNIATVEEHQKSGGLGGIIAEYMAERKTNTKLIRFGLDDEFTSIVGDHEFLEKQYKIDSESIVSTIESIVAC